MRLTWPLNGRAEELQSIEAALSAPELCGLVVCGAAGVGKSRLTRDALDAAASRGCEIRWVVATSSARSIPLGAFASWAPAAATDTLSLVRGVIAALTSDSAPVIVCVDDVHLLDDLSAFVLHQIVQRRAGKVVCTVRDGETVPEAVQEVWKAGPFDRLDLQPLAHNETVALVSAALGGPLDPDVARRLWTLTRGNVLYLRNIVEQEVADGRLAAHQGYWRWTGDPVVSSGLVQTIESRMGALPDAVGEVIDALAVGEPIDLVSLGRISDPAAVEDAEMRGLITLDQVEGGGAQMRLAHPLYGEVRRRRAPSARLRRLRGRVATELAAHADPDDMRTVVRRAELSLDSDLQPDPDLFVRAAQGALAMADLPLADRLADAAIRAGAGAEANYIRGHAISWLGRGEEADLVFAASPTDGFTDADRARLTYLRASNILLALGDAPRAKALVDDAWDATPPDSRDCLGAFLAMYWAMTGNPDISRNSSKNLVLEDLPGVIGAHVCWSIVQAGGDAGRTTEVAEAAAAGYRFVARSFDAPPMTCFIALGHVTALVLSGYLTQAQDVAERLTEQVADLPGAAPLLAVLAVGRANLGAGRLDAARSALQALDELLPFPRESNPKYLSNLSVATALAMRGDTANAVAVLSALPDPDHSPLPWADYERELAWAWTDAAQGSISGAVSRSLSAAETARSKRRFAVEVMCLQTATQFGDRSCAVRLRELAAIVEGPRAQIAARFADALRAGDAAELVAVSGDLERMGDLVAAVDAAAHAALAYRRENLRGSALGCSTRADALAKRCGASTPALRQASETLPLTPREREVVTLIGQGMSNRAVAERLTLSYRTVENHLHNAMTKTGTTNREELAALLEGAKPTRQH